MNMVHWRGAHLSLLVVSWLALGWLESGNSEATAQAKTASKPSQTISIGGEPVATLRRPEVSDRNKPQFLEAEILPGRGMAVLQIRAYLPGRGEIDLLNSPPLPEAAKLLDPGDDEFGNQIFKFGGAILLPFANRIRGKLSDDGKTITAAVAGKTVILPANWRGDSPGAEKHSIHGLMRSGAISRHSGAERRAGNVHFCCLACRQLRWPLAVGHRRESRNHPEP